MPGLSDAFRGNVQEALPGANYDAARGALVNLARTSEQVGTILEKFSKNSLVNLANNFVNLEKTVGKLNKANPTTLKYYTDAILQEGKKLKIDTELLNVGKKALEQGALVAKQKKLENELGVKYFDQRAQHFERERRMLQSQTQMQKDAIDSMEKNFWGPFRNMFKGSNLATFSKDVSKNVGQATTEAINGYYTLMKGVNSSILGTLGDRVGSLMADATGKFTEGIIAGGKELFKSSKDALKEGKQQYYENARDRATKQTERSMENFEKLINDSRNLQDQAQVRAEKSFDGFDNSVDLFNKYIGQATGLLKTQQTDSDQSTKALESAASKLTSGSGGGSGGTLSASAEGADETSRTGALMASLGNLVPVVGAQLAKLVGVVVSSVETLVSDMGSHLAELAVKKFDLRTSLQGEFGGMANAVNGPLGPMSVAGGKTAGNGQSQTDYLASLRNLTFGIDWDDVKEGYSGLVHAFGDLDKISPDIVEYQLQFNKLLGLSGDEGGKLTKIFETIGINIGTSKNDLETLRGQAEKFATMEGVSAKEVMRDMAKQTNWIAMVGSPKMVTEFERSDAQLRAMGLHADTMMKIMGGFEDVGNAMKNTFELNKILGTSFNPVRMNIMAMMGDVSGIQKDVMQALEHVGKLNVLEIKGAAQALGITEEEMRLLDDGAKIEAARLDKTSGIAQLEDQILQSKKYQAQLTSQGFTTPQDQQEYLSKKIASLYEAHKGDFAPGAAGMTAFQKEFSNPTSSMGQTLNAELQASLQPGGTQTSMKGQLVSQNTFEKTQEAHYDEMADMLAGTIIDLNTAMGKFNQTIADGLSTILGKTTKILGTALHAVGLDAAATQIESMGPNLGKGVVQGTKATNAAQKLLGLQHAMGGHIQGPGGPRDDKIPAMLSNGEYVIPAHVVNELGVSFFDQLAGKNKFQTGGNVSFAPYHTNLSIETLQPGMAPPVNPYISPEQMKLALASENHPKNKSRNKSNKKITTYWDGAHYRRVVGDKTHAHEVGTNVPGDLYETDSSYLRGRYGHKDGGLIGFAGGGHVSFGPHKPDMNIEHHQLPGMIGYRPKGKIGNTGIIGTIKHTIKDFLKHPNDYINMENPNLGEGLERRAGIGFLSAIPDILNLIYGMAGGNTEHYEKLKNKTLKKLGADNKSTGKIGNLIEEIGALPVNLISGEGIHEGTAMMIENLNKQFRMFELAAEISPDLKGFSLPTLDKHVHSKAAEMGFEAWHNISEPANNAKRASFARGTLPTQSLIPGFVDTNNIDQMTLHPNENVQVMNQQQKIQRDTTLENLISEIKNLIKAQSNGQHIETDIKWNNEVIGRLVLKSLYNKVI